MPLYQNSSVNTSNLTIGNYKIEVAATTVGSVYTNLGAGIINSFGHNITKYAVQAGNAPDPIEGIATETFTVSGELIEYDASVLSAISGGITTTATTTTQSVLSGGGNTTITPKIFRLTNTRIISGATKTTIITVFKATMDNGLQVTAKSDNDADPINVMPFTITGKPDTALTAGSQLFTITRLL